MIDLAEIAAALERHGPLARVVIAEAKGSTPRSAGTAMLVGANWQAGTIGGGRLEWEAVQAARELLAEGREREVRRQPLGPALGQCCGGSVTLVTELWDAGRLAGAREAVGSPGVFLRRVEGDRPAPARLPERAHTGAAFEAGWLAEPMAAARQQVCIYGAGHVGRALAEVLAPLRRVEVLLADPRRELFDGLTPAVQQDWETPPHEVMAAAGDGAFHFIMTPDHGYDLELCHRLLGREFGHAGLIGSATKWARFRKRLAALGHPPERIDRIACPIGDPALGREPQAIAIGVAADILRRLDRAGLSREAAE